MRVYSLSFAPPGLPARGRWWSLSSLNLLFGLLLTSPAFAYDYGRAIEIDAEEDLYELFSQGEISEEELERLLSLFQQKLDLNQADAEALFALPGVTIDLARTIQRQREIKAFVTLEDLGSVQGFPEELIEQLRPFVEVVPPPRARLPITHRLQLRTGTSLEPGQETVRIEEAASSGRSYYPSELGLETLPEAYLRYRADVGEFVRVGVLAGFGEGPSSYAFDEGLQRFEIAWGRPLVTLPKAYLHIDKGTWSAIAGAFTAGFGQRLVFDESRRYKLNGLLPDDDAYGSDSFSFPQRLFGLGGTYKGLSLGPTEIELTGFYSRRAYDLYQYNFKLPTLLEQDPDDSSNTVLLEGVPVYPMTLPNVYQEQIFGAHALARLDKKTYIGLTGYAAQLIKPFDFEFVSDLPTRDRYGAVGAHFGAALWDVQLNGELALMDNFSAAWYLRAIYDFGPGEILGSAYGYGTDYDNPHSRGFADADEVSGKRDRDETGWYFKGAYKIRKGLIARAAYHHWYRPSLDVFRLKLDGRLDYAFNKRWKLSLWGDWKDKNASPYVTGRSRNYSTGTEESQRDPDVDPDDPSTIPVTLDPELAEEGNGVRSQLGLQARTSAIPGLTLDVSYKRIYTDASYKYYEVTCDEEYGWQVGQDLWTKVRYSPGKKTTLLARFRYLDEDVNGDSGSRLLDAYLQWTQAVKKSHFSVRYGLSRDLIDLPRALETYCTETDSGTCPVDETTTGAEEISEPLLPTHVLWASFETRF